MDALRYFGPAMSWDGGELVAIHTSPPYPQFGLAYSVPPKPEKPERSQRELDDERLDATRDAERGKTREQIAAFRTQGGAVPPRAKQKRKRRSPEEMARVRARAAERIAAAAAEVTPDWLSGKDEDATAFLASLEEE